MKHLKGKGEMWQLYAAFAAYTMNTLVPPALSWFSPFELIFVCKPPDLLNLAFLPLQQFANTRLTAITQRKSVVHCRHFDVL